MNIGKSFSFPFEDKEWISKLGLGAVITLVPILNFAWTGYLVQLIRNVMDGQQEPLPTWDDIGKKLTEGLILALASLVYALPMIIVFCLPMSIMIVPAMMSGNGDMQDIANAIAGVGSALFLCLLCVFLIYALVLSVVYPAILIVFSREGVFASCFKFREIFDLIGKNTGPFLTAWGMSVVVGLGVGLVVGFVSAIFGWIPCIGWAITAVLSLGSGVYVTVVYGHLFGQFGMVAFGQSQNQ